MSECFWNDADAELVDYLSIQLGIDNYTELPVQLVMSGILRDLSDWETLAIAGQIPLVVVQGRLVTGEASEHGDGNMHQDKRYAYTIGGLVDGELSDAVRDAKTLLRRIEKALLAKKGLTSVSSDGERGHYLEILSGEIVASKKRDTTADSWFAVCLLGVRVTSLA